MLGRAASFLSAALLAIGCRGGGEQKPSATNTVASGRSWTTPPVETSSSPIAKALPRVEDWGGPILRNPRIVTVTFKQDAADHVAHLESFGDSVTRTNWWREVVDSYCRGADCIGEARPGPHVHLENVLGATFPDSQIDTIIDAAAKGGRLGQLEPADSLIMVFLPKDVKMTQGDAEYCTPGSPRAVHRALDHNGHRIAYSIIPRCSDLSEATAAASHELIEATTNPDPSKHGWSLKAGKNTNTAFQVAGIEPVDPCGLINMDGHWTFEAGFALQRAWSNRAAAGGHDPCVPSRANRPYMALIPRDTAIRARKGEPAAIQLDASADRPVPSWAISSIDLTGFHSHDSLVDISFDKATVASGDTVTMTVTIKKDLAGQSSVIGVISSLGVIAHMWPLRVVQLK